MALIYVCCSGNSSSLIGHFKARRVSTDEAKYYNYGCIAIQPNSFKIFLKVRIVCGPGGQSLQRPTRSECLSRLGRPPTCLFATDVVVEGMPNVLQELY
jgi:hypothetical protein